MKRRHFLTNATLAIAGSAITAPALAQSQPQIRWRMASSFPKSLDTLFGTAEQIAQRVSRLTEGRFEMRIFAAGEIVPPLQVLDAVQNGTVECGQTASYYYIGKNPALAFDTALPFGMNARQQNAWMYYGGGLQLTREMFQQYNIVNFPCGNTGTQMAGWYRKEIKSVNDLKASRCGSPVSQGRFSRSSASCRSRSAAATSIPRSKKERSTQPSGWDPTMMKNSVSTKSRSTTITPDGGKALRSCQCMSTRSNGRRCRSLTRKRSKWRVPKP